MTIYSTITPESPSFRFTKRILNLLHADVAHKNIKGSPQVDRFKLHLQDIAEASSYMVRYYGGWPLHGKLSIIINEAINIINLQLITNQKPSTMN